MNLCHFNPLTGVVYVNAHFHVQSDLPEFEQVGFSLCILGAVGTSTTTPRDAV